MAVGGDGEDAERKARRAWRRSNWIQAALIFGFIAVVAALDWLLNGSPTYVAAIGIGTAVGLAGLAARRAWRRHSGHP